MSHPTDRYNSVSLLEELDLNLLLPQECILKEVIHELISQALHRLQRKELLPADLEPVIQVDHSRNPEHGDYACNIALMLAKQVGMPPMQLAEAIVAKIPTSRHIQDIEAVKPGFINLRLTKSCLLNLINDILEQGDQFGRRNPEQRHPVTIEFVSANPTGPLHVGHGRGAAYGATLSALLDAIGFDVHREYYVNDNGRQMDILAVSVWLRYLELCGEQVGFPDNGYRGDYIYDIARQVRSDHGDRLRHKQGEVYDNLPPDESQGGDREAYIDAIIARARELLGKDGFNLCFNAALDNISADIRDDLEEFGVHFDRWFSERELEQSGAVTESIEQLQTTGKMYTKDGAQWFEATHYGDEKDRVVVRENGRTTYFASDIAYLRNKLERGFKPAIYVFGADHHGYIPRLRAAAEGMGYNPDDLEILLVQFAILYRGKQRVQMGTRSGEFVTLRQLREEIGNDAARFFYVLRSHEQHMDFDLDQAKLQSTDNPIYYIQYAHARVASVFRNLEQSGERYNQAIGSAALKLLDNDHEQKLLRTLSRYCECIFNAAHSRSPHQLGHYLHDLASDFHTYYNAEKALVDDEDLRNARLNLMAATAQVIRNGLGLLGCTAPEEM